MGLYDAWRKDGGPTLYGPAKSAVTVDVLETGLIFAAIITALSFFIVLPGIRGKERVFSLLRSVIAVFILVAIMLSNFGQEWEVASLHTKTQYRAGLRKNIEANIKVKIGLRSVNITLKGDPVVQEFEEGRVNETINYNERFRWNNEGWTQGRQGFGPYAGLVNQEYREAQLKGLPYPILWIAEYFTIDGEGIRWGRFYRQSGFFSHIMIWLAFPLWIISMVSFYMVLRYGGYFSMLTGGSLILANILYVAIRNPTDLVIPFEDGNLNFTWGWSFWLCLVTGILCLVIGIVVVIIDLRFPSALATFFNSDTSLLQEEIYLDQKELNSITTEQNDRDQSRPDSNGNTPIATSSGLPARPPRTSAENTDGRDSANQVPDRILRRPRGTNKFARRLQKSQKKKPRPLLPPIPSSAGAGPPLLPPKRRDEANNPQIRYTPGSDNVAFQGDS